MRLLKATSYLNTTLDQERPAQPPGTAVPQTSKAVSQTSEPTEQHRCRTQRQHQDLTHLNRGVRQMALMLVIQTARWLCK
jgi:hypothetical protein